MDAMMHKPVNDGEARLVYEDGTFRVVLPGGYVVCAVSRRRIPLDLLRYWRVDRQEAYAGPEEARAGFGR